MRHLLVVLMYTACATPAPEPAAPPDVPVYDESTGDPYDNVLREAVFDTVPEHITFSEANAVLSAHCRGCHWRAAPDTPCVGGVCFVDSWTDTQRPACCAPDRAFGVCDGESPPHTILAECLILRVEETLAGGPSGELRDPKGRILLPETDALVLRRWFEAGAPE